MSAQVRTIVCWCIALLLFCGGEAGFPMAVTVFVIAALVTIVNQARKSHATGSHKEANTPKMIAQKAIEEMALTTRISEQRHLEGKTGSVYLDPRYVEGRKAINEKHAVPGSEAYKEIRQKEAVWEAEHGY